MSFPLGSAARVYCQFEFTADKGLSEQHLMHHAPHLVPSDTFIELAKSKVLNSPFGYSIVQIPEYAIRPGQLFGGLTLPISFITTCIY